MHLRRAPWNGPPPRPTAIPAPAQTPRPTLPRFSGRSGRRESFISPALPFTWRRRPGTLGQSLHPSPEEGRGGSGGFEGLEVRLGRGRLPGDNATRVVLPQPRPPRSFLPCSRLSGQAGGGEGRLPAPAPVAPAAGPFGGPARELVWPSPAAQLAGGRDPAGRCSRSRFSQPPAAATVAKVTGAGRAQVGGRLLWRGPADLRSGRGGTGLGRAVGAGVAAWSPWERRSYFQPPGGAGGAVPGCEGMAGQPQSAAAWDLTMRPFCSAGPAG